MFTRQRTHKHHQLTVVHTRQNESAEYRTQNIAVRVQRFRFRFLFSFEHRRSGADKLSCCDGGRRPLSVSLAPANAKEWRINEGAFGPGCISFRLCTRGNVASNFMHNSFPPTLRSEHTLERSRDFYFSTRGAPPSDGIQSIHERKLFISRD